MYMFTSFNILGQFFKTKQSHHVIFQWPHWNSKLERLQVNFFHYYPLNVVNQTLLKHFPISSQSSWKIALPSIRELTALAFPPTCIALSCSHVQLVSSCVDRIKVTWTPSDLWTAEQSIHRNTPYVTLAHVGLLLLQSKHVWKRS